MAPTNSRPFATRSAARLPALLQPVSACLSALAVGLILLAGLLSGTPVQAQYFGQNKVTYEDFDFKTLETDHFVFHFYPEEEEAVRDAARMAERWYDRHTQVFNHRFEDKKPIILYANDADFKQTNVTNQPLSPGTGGFTEPRRERVVMPLSPSYAETSHVLGHELVHSFQFDMALNGDGKMNLNLIPLWMTEGMAEYFSIGRTDTHTAMWMRDAVLHDNMPTFEELNNPREYFPYRFGQAHLAYIGGKYGDRAVSNLYSMSGRAGPDSAYVNMFGISADSLVNEWGEATRQAYEPLMKGRTSPDSVGTKVLAEDIDAGRTNIGPVLSPDGQYVAFISSRDLFSLNLFVADAETGEVIAELESSGTTRHFNALRFINSAGAWSPDGRKLAFVSYSDGDNQLTIWDVESRSIDKSIRVKGVTAMKNPAWSPNGESIAFSGTNGGISDLYILDLSDNTVRQITNDRHADLQPTWSPDGERLAFTTDRGQTDLSLLDVSKQMAVAEIDVETSDITLRTPFPDALHHNPQYSPDGQSLYFISDQDGFKDVYRLPLDGGSVHRLTRLKTGVSGVTAVSPAMTVASQSGDMMMSVYNDNRYTGFRRSADSLQGTPLTTTARANTAPAVPPAPDTTRRDSSEAPATDSQETTVAAARDTTHADSLRADSTRTDRVQPAPANVVAVGGDVRAKAGVLPPFQTNESGLVATYLEDPNAGLPPPSEEFDVDDYDAGLSLEAILPPRAGVSAGGPLGTSVSGGVALQFGDMLGDQTLTTYLQAQGTIRDIGGGVSYLNQKNQLNWGGSFSHTPVITDVQSVPLAAIVNDEQNAPIPTTAYAQAVRRLQLTNGSIDFRYPLDPTRRFEFSLGATRYGFGVNVRERGFNGDLSLSDLNEALTENNFRPLPPERDTRYYGSASVAYVRDFTQMGLTSPVKGGRWRVEVTPRIGPDSYVSALADLRRYVYAQPFTFAFQAIHVGNYGANPSFDDRFGFGNEYLGFPYGQGFVRGYNIREIDPRRECTPAPGEVIASNCPEIDRLLGTRTATVRAEIRIPLFGPEELAVIPLSYVPTEIALFTDAGIAWTAENRPDFRFSTTSESSNIPVTSAGVAARVNVLGRVILEGYYARPFQRPEQSGEWGLRLIPGW